MDEDVEKKGGLGKIAEKAETDVTPRDEADRKSVRSRARSVKSTRSRAGSTGTAAAASTRSRPDSIHAPNQTQGAAIEDRPRSRSPAPSKAHNEGETHRIPSASTLEEKEKPGSVRSRPATLNEVEKSNSVKSRTPTLNEIEAGLASSVGGTAQPVVPGPMPQSQQAHQPPPPPATTKALDPWHPVEFAIQHHLDNLVVPLAKYQPGPLLSALNVVKSHLPGRTAPPPPPPGPDDLRFRISFAEVQRLRIRKLQSQLVRHVVDMRTTESESRGWEDTLKEYIKALQDHDYMEKRSKSPRDPFLATGEYTTDNYVLNSNINTSLASLLSLPSNKPVASLKQWEYPSSTHQESIVGTRTSNLARSEWRGFKDRVLLAALGGAFLIGPMWLMVLQTGKYTALVTTTGFVTGFGVIMAYFLEEGKDVLASTAAYAAVLVVFVGTSTPSPTTTGAGPGAAQG